ncbi:C2 domain [Dillenia turbinata]|uniref:C2 domain n=1 Tax=Dillenia turbinata TaxID=194707 RepID=A0AAN8ZG59_9MAGN
MYSRHEVQVTISSANHLKNVNWRHGDIRPFAIVWVDPNNKFTTGVADGDTCPFWDEQLVIQLTDPVDDSILHIDIVHANPEEDTKPLIGSARLPLSEVIDDVGFNEPLKRTLRLRRPSGRPQGQLEVEVVLSEHRYHAPEPYYEQPDYATVMHTTHVHHEEHRRDIDLGAMAVGAATGLLGGLAIAEAVEELLDD